MLVANKPNLHGQQHADDIHSVVCDVETQGVASSDQQHQDIDGQEVDDENVASPCRDHVEISEGRRQRPRQRPRVHRLHEQVKREHEGENRHRLVVVGACHGAGNVARADGQQDSGHQPRAPIPQLRTEEIGHHGGIGREEGRREHAHVLDVHGEGEEAHRPVDERGRNHEARVQRAAHNAAQRVPALIVEPIPELVEPLLRQVERGAVIEVGVELVDHALVA